MNRVSVHLAKPVPQIFRLTAFIVLLAGAIAGQNAPPSAADRANLLARAGRTEEAVRLLQAILAARPADLDARLALADIYARNSQSDKAEQEFREALRLYPESPSAEVALGAFYTNAGSLSNAEQVLNDAARQHPNLVAGHAQLAMVLAMERKYAQAETHIRLVPPPADPKARVRYFRLVASIHSGLGDARAAAQAMEEALHAMPEDEQLQLLASITETEAGEWQACIRNVSPLFARHPAPDNGLILLRAQLANHADFTATLQSLRALDLPEDQKLQLRVRSAEVLASADQHREAVEELRDALKIAGGSDGTLLYNLAVEQYHSRQFDEALATLAPLRGQRDSAEIEDLAGDIEEKSGDSKSAIHSHENAITLAPGEERYRLSLGAELLQYGNYETAATVFQQATTLFPKSARIYVGLGMADYFMDKYDDSVSAFLLADKLAGGSERAIQYLASTQVDSAAGPAPAAVDAVCGRADSHPVESAAVTWCGALLFRKAYLAGDQSAAPEAIRRLRIAAKLAPNNPVASCSLGHALEWTNQLAEARHWLENCVQLRTDSAEDHYRLSHVYQRLGLTQAAAEQADLTNRVNAEQDQNQALARKFADEMLGEATTTTDSK